MIYSRSLGWSIEWDLNTFELLGEETGCVGECEPKLGGEGTGTTFREQ